MVSTKGMPGSRDAVPRGLHTREASRIVDKMCILGLDFEYQRSRSCLLGPRSGNTNLAVSRQASSGSEPINGSLCSRSRLNSQVSMLHHDAREKV